MDQLKLLALDQQDLEIVSAHVQDAILKVGDMDWRPAEKRFVIEMRRFVWEKKKRMFARDAERRLSVLSFDRVTAARISGFSLARKDEVLELLALRFAAGEEPSGSIEIDFAGAATVRLEVECIEAQLADLGAAWSATSRPSHPG